MRRTKGVQGKKKTPGLTTNALIEVRDEPTHGPHLGGEEVGSDECRPVRLHKRPPWCRALPSRRNAMRA